MADFEMPYFLDGGGNKGYFKDTTAREQITDKCCEGGRHTAVKPSLTSQMDNAKASGKSGVFPMYCSSVNDDFPTIGYCEALGFLGNGNVSNIIAVNSQTGDIWTNGNTSQTAGAWIGWKNNSAFSLVSKGTVESNSSKTIDVGSSNGAYLLFVAQNGNQDLLGLYLIKVTHYQAGTVVKTIVTPSINAPTVTAAGIASTGSITITASGANFCYSLAKINLSL